MRRLHDLLKTGKENAVLVVILLAIALVCALVWAFGSAAASSFGLNALTETLGILVTVLLVDHLIQRQSERRALPQRAAAYEDTRLFLARMIGLWTDAYSDSAIGPAPRTISDLFSGEAFDDILTHLNIDGQANVVPRRQWFEWFPERLTELRKQGECILERHNSILAPEAYSWVHQLSTEGPDPGYIRVIRDLDRSDRFPRPTNLGSYWPLPEAFLQSVLALVEWAQKEETYLRAAGVAAVRAAPRTVKTWEPNHTPRSRISDQELMQQIALVDKFRAEKPALKP